MNLTVSGTKPYNQRLQTTPRRYSLYNEAANKYAVTSGNLIIKLALSDSASNYFDLSDASTVASDAVYLTASVSSAKCLSIIDQSFGIVDTDDCQPLYLYKLESDSSDYAMQSSIRALNGGEVFPTEKVEYIYGNSAWGDQLTQIKTYSISTNGTQTLTNTQTLSYDAMGNPTSYLGTTMTWQGKQLTTVSKNGNNYGYFYDENGLRLRKTTNGVATNYHYNGSALIGMTQGTTYQRFSYDASGSVVSVDYSTNSGSTYTTYYYLQNGQGDIVKLIDNSGSTVVEYKYDSWGKQLSCTGSLSTTLGQNQPFRYRDYVYDSETSWYYLQSRYYNPEIGRFISADVYLSTGQGVLGHNAYAYCLNNPVNMADYSGLTPDFSIPDALGELLLYICDAILSTIEVKGETKTTETMVKDLLFIRSSVESSVGNGARERKNGSFFTATTSLFDFGLGLSIYVDNLTLAVTTKGMGLQIEAGYGSTTLSVGVQIVIKEPFRLMLELSGTCTTYTEYDVFTDSYSYSSVSLNNDVDVFLLLSMYFAYTSENPLCYMQPIPIPAT